MPKNIYTIKETLNKVNEFCEYDDNQGAYFYRKGLKNFLDEHNLKTTDPLYKKYYDLTVKLKFLSLNFFDDWKVIYNLIKNHFEAIYDIKYYNLWEKIKTNLLAISDLSRRNNIKEELKKVLLDCDRPIINKNKYKNISNLPIKAKEWLKDYNANLGIKNIDNLKRIQYLTNGENIKKLNKEDKEKIKTLFDFFEELKKLSNTPEGYEDDVPMVVNGKYVIFSGGEAEEIKPDIISLIKSIKTGNEKEDKINELANISAQYPPASLERRAIEEEIERLNH